MARARNLKPGFFKNESLAECSLAARLCFAGLWTLADREGRLEDRPKRIKGELFAFDSIEVEPLLRELEHHGFIERYAVDGLGLIQVIAFSKHQNPHHREPPSDLPPPQSLGLFGDATRSMPEAYGGLHEPKARGKPEASPGLDHPKDDLERGSSRADPGTLNPEHSFRSPDPGTRTTDAGRVCLAMRRAGLSSVQSGHPDLLVLLEAGATDDEFVSAAQQAAEAGKGFAYALAIVKNRRVEAAKTATQLHRGPLPQAPPRHGTTAADRRAARVEAFTGPPRHERRTAPENTDPVIDVDARAVG